MQSTYKLDDTGLKNTLVDRPDAHDGHHRQWKYGKPKRLFRTKIGQMDAEGRLIQPPKPRTKVGQKNAKGRVIQPRAKVGQMDAKGKVIQPPKPRTKIGQMDAKGKVIQPPKPRTLSRYTAEVSSKIAKQH